MSGFSSSDIAGLRASGMDESRIEELHVAAGGLPFAKSEVLGPLPELHADYGSTAIDAVIVENTTTNPEGVSADASYVEAHIRIPATAGMRSMFREYAAAIDQVAEAEDSKNKMRKSYDDALVHQIGLATAAGEQEDPEVKDMLIAAIDAKKASLLVEHLAALAKVDATSAKTKSLERFVHELARGSWNADKRAKPSITRTKLEVGDYIVKNMQAFKNWRLHVTAKQATLSSEGMLSITLPRGTSLTNMVKIMFNYVRLGGDLQALQECIANKELLGSYSGPFYLHPAAE